MKIAHLALWVADLEVMKAFYTKYFHAQANELYFNPKKKFKSYFLSFEENGCQLEIMQSPLAHPVEEGRGMSEGMAHFAISVGSKPQVNELTEQLRGAGFTVAGEPRTTGDGFYESMVLDPEGNLLEITS